MSEKDINIEYICNKTLLDKDDELVPIILEMIQESYGAGLSQSEYDNTMGLIKYNEELKDQIRKQKEINKKAIKYINKFKDSPEYIDAYDITYWQDEVLSILEDKGE